MWGLGHLRQQNDTSGCVSNFANEGNRNNEDVKIGSRKKRSEPSRKTSRKQTTNDEFGQHSSNAAIYPKEPLRQSDSDRVTNQTKHATLASQKRSRIIWAVT